METTKTESTGMLHLYQYTILQKPPTDVYHHSSNTMQLKWK